MKKLLYYPGFDINDIDWIKFALLYVDTLMPIIPASGDSFISDLTLQLKNESNLLVPYRPEFQEGNNASLDAIEIIEKVLRNPERYSTVFSTSQINDVWKNKDYYDSLLFSEKYIYQFERFILDNNLGEKRDEGLLASRQLIQLYMSILSQAISDKTNIPAITDDSDLDKFSIFTRRNYASQEGLNIYKNVIQLHLPENIGSIPLETILKFRAKSDFIKLKNAFVEEVEEYIINGGKNIDVFIKELKSHKELIKELGILSGAVIGFSLGLWSMLQTPETKTLEYLQKGSEVLGLIGGTYAFIQFWNNTQSRRFCKKYLADLNSLSKA